MVLFERRCVTSCGRLHPVQCFHVQRSHLHFLKIDPIDATDVHSDLSASAPENVAAAFLAEIMRERELSSLPSAHGRLITGLSVCCESEEILICEAAGWVSAYKSQD